MVPIIYGSPTTGHYQSLEDSACRLAVAIYVGANTCRMFANDGDYDTCGPVQIRINRAVKLSHAARACQASPVYCPWYIQGRSELIPYCRLYRPSSFGESAELAFIAHFQTGVALFFDYGLPYSVKNRPVFLEI